MDELIVFFRSMHMLPRDQRMAVRARRRGYHERFRALVEEGQREGLFKPVFRPISSSSSSSAPSTRSPRGTTPTAR